MGEMFVLKDIARRLVPLLDPALSRDLGVAVLVGRLPAETAGAWSYRTASLDRAMMPPLPDGSGLTPDTNVFTLTKAPTARAHLDIITVGRAPSNDLVMAHSMVSKLHARFRLGATITVEDAGSSNGLKVQSRAVPSETAVPVPDGAMVSFGGAVLTLFRQETLLRLVERLARSWT